MIAIDPNILSMIIYPGTSVPDDHRTGQPIALARERANQLVEEASRNKESVLIAAPILAEVLVVVASRDRGLCHGTGAVAYSPNQAVRCALRTRAAKDAGDKRDGARDSWAKVKYDRQLLAIAKVEGVGEVYSTDAGVLTHTPSLV